MSSSPFGEHLKREREMRGVSLEEISAVTRISTRFLDALENGRWEQLPGGAFNRGFIRTTAKFLGLDEDSMVSEYAQETGNSGDSTSSAAGNAALPRNWRPLILAIGVMVAVMLVIAASVFAYRRHRAHQAAAIQSALPPVQTPVAPPPPSGSTGAPIPSPDNTLSPDSSASPSKTGSGAAAPAGDSH